jgi:hypothetical protein
MLSSYSVYLVYKVDVLDLRYHLDQIALVLWMI